MTLASAHGQWLTDGDPADLRRALASAEADMRWRGTLLDAYLNGVAAMRMEAPTCWAGALVHLGAAPPAQAPQGSLWFDPAELALHILVSRDPDEMPPGADPALGWLATEPVRLFQWRAFLDHAPMERVAAQKSGDFIPFLPRDFPGLDTAVATGMSAPEARLYAVWFGKALPTAYDWECAAHLGDHRIRDLQVDAAPREWLGDDAGDPTMAVAAGPDQWEVDPRDQLEFLEMGTEPAPDERVVYPRLTRDATIGLRTRVIAQFGLVTELSPRGATELGLRLVAKARR